MNSKLNAINRSNDSENMKKIIIILLLASCQINKQEVSLNRDYSNARFSAVYDVQILSKTFIKDNYITGKLLGIRYKNISNYTIEKIQFKWTTERGVESGIVYKKLKPNQKGQVYFNLIGRDISSVKNLFVAKVNYID